MTDSTPERASWGQLLKRVLKPLLIIVVVLGIGQSIHLAWKDLEANQSKAYNRIIELRKQVADASPEKQASTNAEISAIEKSLFSIQNIRWGMAAWAIVIALIAITPAALYWWLTLRSFGYVVPFMPTFATFSTGILGKYVPGKAMVLIIRSGAMQQFGVPISTSIVSIFIETLTSLAVGGALGAITLTALHPPAWLFWTAVGVAVVSLIPTIPPFFRRVLEVLTRYRHLRLPKKLAAAMSWRLVASGWVLFFISWILMGTSLWVLCEAIRNSAELNANATTIAPITSFNLWWICVSATCLGFVIGFVSMLPGGAGVREVVVTMLLAPAIGYAPALAAAVLYRIANLIAELLLSAIAWLLARFLTK